MSAIVNALRWLNLVVDSASAAPSPSATVTPEEGEGSSSSAAVAPQQKPEEESASSSSAVASQQKPETAYQKPETAYFNDRWWTKHKGTWYTLWKYWNWDGNAWVEGGSQWYSYHKFTSWTDYRSKKNDAPVEEVPIVEDDVAEPDDEVTAETVSTNHF